MAIRIGSKLKIKLNSNTYIVRVVGYDDNNIQPYIVQGSITTQRISENQIIEKL